MNAYHGLYLYVNRLQCAQIRLNSFIASNNNKYTNNNNIINNNINGQTKQYKKRILQKDCGTETTATQNNIRTIKEIDWIVNLCVQMLHKNKQHFRFDVFYSGFKTHNNFNSSYKHKNGNDLFAYKFCVCSIFSLFRYSLFE